MASVIEGKTAPPPGLTRDTPSRTPGRPYQRKPNYSNIHAKPLPVEVYPFPTFIPHNPLSLLRVAYTLISQYAFPPSSLPGDLYLAVLSPETSSVVLTDPRAVRALWESGFFGKGSLSRSEPTWLAQERKRRGLDGGLTSEMYTQQRRRERIEMKNERARLQREAVEEQLKAERSIQLTEATQDAGIGPDGQTRQSIDGLLPTYSNAWDPATGTNNGDEGTDTSKVPSQEEAATDVKSPLRVIAAAKDDIEAQLGVQEGEEPIVKDEEHLQLSLEEAFFLVYAIGVLQVKFANSQDITEVRQLLQIARRYSYFPPKPADALRPDDPFLVNYVVYHHFRSLGWVIRPGNKFAVDYLLYKGGPVFSHAEFAVVIVPSYVDDWWLQTSVRRAEVDRKREEQQWWWVQNMNRVQTQVLKTLVLVYVDIPSPQRIDRYAEEGNVGGVLKQYKVREFVLKRWTPNRQRE